MKKKRRDIIIHQNKVSIEKGSDFDLILYLPRQKRLQNPIPKPHYKWDSIDKLSQFEGCLGLLKE